MSKRELTKPLTQLMQETHPIHGIFGEVFESLGGVQRMEEWANENYTDFARIFAKMAPRPMTRDSDAKIQILIHNSLGHSPLDG